jgi:hypothetical protein
MLNMQITIEGDQKFKALLQQIERLDTVFAGVRLIGKREDGVDSDDIVDSLIEHDRDFFSPDDAVAEDVAQAAAIELEKRLAAAAAKGRPNPTDNALAGGMLKAAMMAYMKAVVDRIESQRTASGGAPQDLTPAYAAYKEKKFGFVTPIGKASGQLLEALTPGGGTAGKIELVTAGQLKI